jgi:hypothetical protein
MVFAAKRLGGFAAVEHAREVLGALVDRAAEPDIETNQQNAVPAGPVRPLRLRERLGLNGEAAPRDLAVAIASCTREEARRILDHIDEIADKQWDPRSESFYDVRYRAFDACANTEDLPHGDSAYSAMCLLCQRGGEPLLNDDADHMWDVSSSGARRMLARMRRAGPLHRLALRDAGITRTQLPEKVAISLTARLQQIAAQDSAVTGYQDSLRPRMAWDDLAYRLNRHDLVGMYLDYRAGSELARIAAPPAEQNPEIRDLFVAAGLNAFFMPHMTQALLEVHPTRLRERLQISQPDQTLESLVERIADISHDDAIDLLRALTPAAIFYGNSDLQSGLGRVLVECGNSEGIRFTDLHYGDTGRIAAAGRRAFRSLLNRIGFPDLSNVNSKKFATHCTTYHMTQPA